MQEHGQHHPAGHGSALAVPMLAPGTGGHRVNQYRFDRPTDIELVATPVRHAHRAAGWLGLLCSRLGIVEKPKPVHCHVGRPGKRCSMEALAPNLFPHALQAGEGAAPDLTKLWRCKSSPAPAHWLLPSFKIVQARQLSLLPVADFDSLVGKGAVVCECHQPLAAPAPGDDCQLKSTPEKVCAFRLTRPCRRRAVCIFGICNENWHFAQYWPSYSAINLIVFRVLSLGESFLRRLGKKFPQSNINLAPFPASCSAGQQ